QLPGLALQPGERAALGGAEAHRADPGGGETGGRLQRHRRRRQREQRVEVGLGRAGTAEQRDQPAAQLTSPRSTDARSYTPRPSCAEMAASCSSLRSRGGWVDSSDARLAPPDRAGTKKKALKGSASRRSRVGILAMSPL